MKKLKIYLIQVFILCLVLAGCDKFIDVEPRDQLSMDKALSTLENLEGAILGVYHKARYPYSDYDHSLYKLFYTDILKSGTHIVDQRIWNEMCNLQNFDATNEGVEDIWDAYYAGLSRANIIIEKIDEVEYNENNPSDLQRRNTVLGEAYYFRAYLHLSLIQYWDNIILADKVFNDPAQEYVLASKSDVYSLIVSDLETAIGLLPETSDVSSRGKVSKGVARHVMSLAHMDLGNWSEAAAMAEEVIADAAYEFAELDSIFSEFDQDNHEIIFSWQFIPGAADTEEEGQNWTACQLIPLYDRCNGVLRTFEQGGRPWSRNVPNDYYFSLFEEDDLRLEAWHKRYWIYDSEDPADPIPDGAELGDTVTEENINDIAGLGMSAIYPTTTKYWEYGGLGRDINDAPGYEQVICYRYSEALLIAAEAYLQSGTNLARGQELLDQLRARAGQGSIELTLDNLIDEQARELGFEGRRYPMLKRLGILLDRIVTYNEDLAPVILPFHVRWPLPKVFVDLTGVQQNEGYE
ncbi:MAG: RagB/SusD family nutrient uptake outer membrane protein [Bacteroidales bacterium]|nr:MAG: RagB/SusD family nutrient uptake outer membrane protein [Bacteroidales bacterium]